MKFDRNYRGFYERAFEGADYATGQESETHAFSESLIDFLSSYRLLEGRCLEVGSGRGAFQDLVEDYYGIDIAWSAGKFLTKLFTVASATDLPYPAKSFDAIWSITVLEHVPEPERALQEMWRVLKTGGYLFLAPAWQCRPWAAQGYAVRPYSDFGFRGKLIKASIPLRDSLLFRSLSIFPRRIVRLVTYLLTNKPSKFHYQVLEPNYEFFWQSDSDAVNSMDPFEVYIWYRSRGASCLNYSSVLDGLLIRTGQLIFKKSSV